jgi:ribose transport system ATP-binding protein
MTTDAPLLEMSGITKRFPGVVALRDVSITLGAGEVLALMGENGAGKSTLMKILGGAYPPDEGEIRLDGKKVALTGIREAKRLGIALIHQELMLAPNLDVAANIFLGNEKAPGGLVGPLPRGRLNAEASRLIERVGLKAEPTTPVSSLTTGQMQMVEIAKALSLNARIIVMDEPTASLTAGESEHLFGIIRKLRTEGIGIVYISHRLEEVFALSDRITVLRDGRYVGDIKRDEATHDRVVQMMVGRELSNQYFPARVERPEGDVVLEVSDIVVPGTSARISFQLRSGEILGFAGLVGSGRTEVMQTIFGVTQALAGTMSLKGERYAPQSPRDAIERGVYLAPEDRKHHGLVLPMTIAENTSLPNVHNYARFGFLDRTTERKVAEAEVLRLRTKTPSIQQQVVNLSGGNQQKVVLGKWLAMGPKILILDEPTRGIDVGAKSEIYRHMAELASEGIAIIMVSSDMEEILGMSDRVVVMREKRIMGILSRAELSQERIATLMTGAASGEAA